MTYARLLGNVASENCNFVPQDHATVVVFLLLELVGLISLYPESKKGAPCLMGRM